MYIKINTYKSIVLRHTNKTTVGYSDYSSHQRGAAAITIPLCIHLLLTHLELCPTCHLLSCPSLVRD